MKRNALITAIAAATLSTSVLAAEVGTDAAVDTGAADTSTSVEAGTEGFTQLDANADGNISRDEAQNDPRLSSQWDKLDANADGNVDESEFSALEGNAPSNMAPEGKPEGLGAPGASDTAPGADQGANPPGLNTQPGASEAAPGQM